MSARRELPTGVDNYISAVTNYYYVDKTQFIGDLLPAEGKVFLFTRPRRFGKTLTISMLKTFFEKTDEDTSVYFRDKKVWAMGERVTKEQGKYPVISMTLKGADCETWDKTLHQIKGIISKECKRHPELEFSDKVDCDDVALFKAMKSMKAEDGDCRMALDILERMLHDHYGVKPIVLIDEYDAPIQAGHENGYYNSVISFIKDFLTNGLKSNDDLNFAVLTGVLRISKESIFSDLNNLNVYSILRRKGENPDEKKLEESGKQKDEKLPEKIDTCFTSYFGFTLDEVKEMLRYYGYSRKIDEVVEWYDGYTFGDAEVFNPLSVLEYVKSGCIADSYWVNTSGNVILSDLLEMADESMECKIVSLLQGETIQSPITESVVYADLDGGDEQIFSVLLFSGYLKAVGKVKKDQNIAHMAAADGSFPEGAIFEVGGGVSDEYLLKIPNKEVWSIFRKEVFKKLKIKSEVFLENIWSAVQRRDCETLESLLRDYLLSTASSHDVGGKEVTENERFNKEYEAFYHGMWMGFAAYTSSDYCTISNEESGEGRYDLTLEPRDKRYPAIILEFKHLRDKSETLQDMAKSALAQIDEKHYDAKLKNRGCKNIIKVGIAYLGKDVAVAM